MAYGFRVLNGEDEVLIDSDYNHYHFVEKLQYHSVSLCPKLLDGPTNSWKKAPNSPNDLDSDQPRGYIFKFRFNSNGVSPPMCFIKPFETGANAPYVSIVLTKKEGTYWEIWVLQTPSTSTYIYSVSQIAPILYCFSPINQISDSVVGDYGFQTFNSSGDTSFDSRLKPLRILDTQISKSPSLANTGKSDVGSTTNIDLSVNVTPKSYPINNAPALSSDIIYYCPSIAHACQDRKASRSDSGFQAAGYNSYFYAWARKDLWWTFYRGGYRIGANNVFQSSYIGYCSGHVWNTAEDTSSLLGALAAAALGAWHLAVALAVGAAAFTGIGMLPGAYYPYSNDSRNTNLSNPFLISSAAFYDNAENAIWDGTPDTITSEY